MDEKEKAAHEVETHKRLVLKDVIPDDPVNRKSAIRNSARLTKRPEEKATVCPRRTDSAEGMAEQHDITVCQFDRYSFLQIDGVTIPVKDYKISSSMHGRTELEVVMEFSCKITEFSSKASSSERSRQSQKSKNCAP